MGPSLPPEIAYLTDAAHLLRQRAPETAARLMRVRHELLLRVPGAGTAATRPLSDVQRQEVCTACGNIFVPGRDGDSLRIVPAGPAQRRRRHRATVAARLAASGKTDVKTAGGKPADGKAPVAPRDGEWGATKVFTCGRCRSKTRVRLPAPPRVTRTKTRSKRKAQDPDQLEKHAKPQGQPPLVSLQPKPADMMEVKQAANSASKQRKKSRKAGLQALLAGQASSQTKSFSLMDFKK